MDMHRVFEFDDHDCTEGLEVRYECFDDLGGEALLHLPPLGEHVHQPGQFAQSGDFAVMGRDVVNVRHSVERHQVVLAGGVERNVLDQDQFLVFQAQGGGQDFRGVLVKAREDLGVGLGHPFGVSRSPPRSGSSTMANRISRTAASIPLRSTLWSVTRSW